MPKHHHQYHGESDTETISKLRGGKWWAKWLSIGGVGTIAAILVALPQIKEVFAYGHDFALAPIAIQTLQTNTVDAMKVVQGEIDTIQMHEFESREWRARTDVRLDNFEKLLNRILDNQERQNRNIPPRQKDP